MTDNTQDTGIAPDPAEAAARRFYDKSYEQPDATSTPAAVAPPVAPATQTLNPQAEADRVARNVFPSMSRAEPAALDPGFKALAEAPIAEPGIAVLPAMISTELQAGAEAAGYEQAEAASIAAGWSATFTAHGASPDEARALIAAGNELVQLGGAPDEATFASWEQQSWDALGREFGGREAAERALKVGQEYVQRHPALRDFLLKTGLGSNPACVKTVVAIARRSKAAGRF